jgi:hypothetical protein
MAAVLNTKQADLLRYLSRQSGPVPIDHLDGRVLRALIGRDYVVAKNGWATPTEAGRTYGLAPAPRRRRRSQQKDHNPRSARAQMILNAVEALERAMPIDAEVFVGEMPAYADDVLEALRQFARQMQVREKLLDR